MTSSPCFQSAGVATRCLAVICRESIDAQDFREIAPRGHRIDQHQLDLLVRPDDEDVADSLVVGGRARERIARRRGRQHVVELGDVEIGVADHRIVRRGALRLLDVLRPLARVCRRDRRSSPISLTPRLSNSGFNFARAPSSVVQTGVKSFGCENKSAQLLPIQSWNLTFAFGGLGFEIGGGCANLECHDFDLISF